LDKQVQKIFTVFGDVLTDMGFGNEPKRTSSGEGMEEAARFFVLMVIHLHSLEYARLILNSWVFPNLITWKLERYPKWSALGLKDSVQLFPTEIIIKIMEIKHKISKNRR
jgi:hypothetical protein